MNNVLEEFSKLSQKEKFNQLRKWDIEYYEQDNPSVSDEIYDACLREYNGKYKKKYVSALGSNSSIFEKYEHQYPVLSLDKVTDRDNFEDRIQNTFGYNSIAQPKLDGLTVVYYPDGKLVSRGNGHIGEVLPFANKVMNLPPPLDYPIRMEAVITKEDYENNFKDSSKNPRNLVAGILRRKDYTDDIKFVEFYAYNILGADHLSQLQQLDYLLSKGFKIPETYYITNEGSMKYIFRKMEEWSKEQEYVTDGVVIKSNLPKNAKDYGSTSHHPNNAFAYKFVSKVAETILRNIEWSRVRNKLTPVAIFDPVELNGSTVTRASLHNMNIIKKLNVKIGSKVGVTLKNEIIPQIIYSDEKGEDIVAPTICPCCGKHLFINDSLEIICDNPGCSMYLESTMNRIVSKSGLDIRGLSEKTIDKIMETSVISNPFEILSDSYTKLSDAGLSDNQALLVAIRIETAKEKTNPANFLYACNIPHVGFNTAKNIFKRFKTFDNFLDNWATDGINIDGIGDETYAEIKYYLPYIKKCAEYISSFEEPKEEKVVATKGTIVITGKLSIPKDSFRELIEKAGYGYSDNITKETTYLIADDINGNSSKLKKAREKGIKIITEDEFFNLS